VVWKARDSLVPAEVWKVRVLVLKG